MIAANNMNASLSFTLDILPPRGAHAIEWKRVRI